MPPFQVTAGRHLASCVSRVGRMPLRACRPLGSRLLPRGQSPSALPSRTGPVARPRPSLTPLPAARRRTVRSKLPFQVTAGRHLAPSVTRVGQMPPTGFLASGPLPRGPTPSALPSRTEAGASPGRRATLGSGPWPFVDDTAGPSDVAACGTGVRPRGRPRTEVGLATA